MAAQQHAKNRPPSSAKRWLSCPFSAKITEMYPHETTVQSLKGDTWHDLMQTLITFGTLPLDADADAAEELETLKDFVNTKVLEGGPGTRTFVEQRLDIPETGEFGTADIVIVSPAFIYIIDEKSGYVPVNVERNDQMMVYLLGAIALYGKRPKYVIAIHQPNFDHIDGTMRSYEVTEEELDELRFRIKESLKNPDMCNAGPWCKATYCPHRGACEAFHTYTQDYLSLGWHSTEVKAMKDSVLASALDAADELGGYRAELRAEAMRRLLGDRAIEGYKIVKGRRSRAVADPAGVVAAVKAAMGSEWALRLFDGLEWAELDLLPAIAQDATLSPSILKFLGTPKHIEDVIKQYARQAKLPRGTWETVYTNVVGKYIRETSGGLTLEKAIDGRPAHKRGSEFGILDPANGTEGNTII